MGHFQKPVVIESIAIADIQERDPAQTVGVSGTASVYSFFGGDMRTRERACVGRGALDRGLFGVNRRTMVLAGDEAEPGKVAA